MQLLLWMHKGQQRQTSRTTRQHWPQQQHWLLMRPEQLRQENTRPPRHRRMWHLDRQHANSNDGRKRCVSKQQQQKQIQDQRTRTTRESSINHTIEHNSDNYISGCRNINNNNLQENVMRHEPTIHKHQNLWIYIHRKHFPRILICKSRLEITPKYLSEIFLRKGYVTGLRSSCWKLQHF